MSADAESDKIISPIFVRDQLDEILAKEITSLLNVDSNTVMMSFNLSSISCITLIIDKEREIKQFSDSPPERYTIKTFLDELIEIGLENDQYLEKTLNAVMDKGYISIEADGYLAAEMPAFMMVGFLDNMFPGMPGLNLVAFVLQMNDEVNSGRKTLELAKDSFKSILKSRGVAVSQKSAREKAEQMVHGKMATSNQEKELSRKLKKGNLNRLSSLIKKRRKKSTGKTSQLKIKNVFDKEPSENERHARDEAVKKAEKEAEKAEILAQQLAEKEKKIKEAEKRADEASRRLEDIEKREQQLQSAKIEAQITTEKASELQAREAQMAEKEARLQELEQKLKAEREKKLKSEKEDRLKQQVQEAQHEEIFQADDDLEARIAEFENELAMPCPICKAGRIESKTTDKDKEFFSCTTPDCRFVSWDKPYHFECPLCRNPYLSEMSLPGDEKGLKCPRASCSYSQKNLLDPQSNAAKPAPKKKKKRRVVRRKRR